MKISRLFVGIVALSLAAAVAQAAPGVLSTSFPAGPGFCACATTETGGGVCAEDASCAGLAPCGGANPPCGAGTVCTIDTCCGTPVCSPLCPTPGACAAGGTCAAGFPACQAEKPEDCLQAVPAGTPVTPCNDTTPTYVGGGCAGGGATFDKWVDFVATATAHRVRTDVASSGSDSVIRIRSGLCPGVEIGCNDDIGPGAYLSDACVTGLTVGATYHVQVGAYGDGVFGACIGDYVVTVQTATCGDGTVGCGEECDPPGPCCSATCQDIDVCGDNVRCGTEACDGTDDAACPGLCSGTCTCNLPVCGDNIINQTSEECDGTATPGCPAGEYCGTNCLCIEGIPAVSEWGLAVLTLIGLVSGTILFGRRRAVAH